MEEYSFWEDYWAQEEQAYIDEREEERELSLQSQQIAYEAEARRGFPLGKIPAPVVRTRR